VIEADYPTLLTQLLHYPAPSPTYPLDPSLILSQALFLRDNISPASGVEVVIQNQDLLGVRAQPPERADDNSEHVRAESRGSRGRGRGRPNSSQQPRAGVQGLAQGWIDRAQAAGLDKAVLSAVSDLRVCHPLCFHTEVERELTTIA
jgi:TBC1 domain family protein 5